MTYKPWDIILVPFPFTDLSRNKKRPALVISPKEYNKGYDLIIMFITSKLSTFGRPGDYKIAKWREAGLPKPSMTRMKLATIEKDIVIKKFATLQDEDRKSIQNILINFFSKAL
jgi:mRNA interferase MazF